MTAYDIVINANLQGRMSFAFAVERERSVGMKYMVIGILIFGSIVLGWILKNIVWPAIKADPVSNLIMSCPLKCAVHWTLPRRTHWRFMWKGPLLF